MGIEKRLQELSSFRGYPEELCDPQGIARDALSAIYTLKHKLTIAERERDRLLAGIKDLRAEFDAHRDEEVKHGHPGRAQIWDAAEERLDTLVEGGANG